MKIEELPELFFLTGDAVDRAWFRQLVSRANSIPLYSETPGVTALRQTFLEFATSPLARAMPENISTCEVEASGVPCCWFQPPSSRRKAPILYFHGGGYVCGSIKGARGIAASLAQAFSAPVLAVGYRQAPENPFPAAIEDATTSYAWLARQIPEPITIIGDSAGGGLAVTVAMEALRNGLRPARGVITISGIFDLAMSGKSWRNNQGKDLASLEMGTFLYGHYLGGAAPQDPRASPIYRDLHGGPSMLVIAGGHEMMLDDSEMLVARARSAGVRVQYDVYDEMPHNFVKFARPSANFAIERMVEWESRIA